MKYRAAIILLGLGLLATACSEPDAATEDSQTVASSSREEIVLHDFHDKQSGMVVVQIPLPVSWKVNSNISIGDPSVTGPSSLTITDFPAQNYLYTHDQQAQQFHRQTGAQIRKMPGIDQLIEEDAKPWASTQGLTFVRKYNIPEIARIDEWYDQQLFKVSPTQSQFAAIGTEWKNQNGDPVFILIHLAEQQISELQTWYYFVNLLKAEPDYFEDAKQHLIFGLANSRYNPQNIQAYNQREQQKSTQHQDRLAANQANFEASQRAIRASNNAVSDAIMGGWRERNAIRERGHSQYIDSIHDRTTVTNRSSGQTYKVEAGANNYWMNQGGEYISTDNYNYNPNIDPNLNQENWQQLEE